MLLMIGAQPVFARLFLNSLEFLLHAREECILQDGIRWHDSDYLLPSVVASASSAELPCMIASTSSSET